MTTYKVVEKDTSHVVLGLPWFGETDSMLIYHYAGGDIDTRMRDPEMMHCALYDLLQTHDELKDGDRFETEHGNFVCSGIHVEKETSAFELSASVVTTLHEACQDELLGRK
jgi:hypothetical protein